MKERALFSAWPALSLPWVTLGDFPTRIDALDGVARAIGCAGAPLYAKRDDLSSPIYGGNKVRTLEALFGHAKAGGAKIIYSTGAYGSNHALAAILHAPRAGLEPGAILFPQPPSHAAVENLRVMIARCARMKTIPHWSFLPFAMIATRMREPDAFVMVPGGATPVGALGYVSAALELAQQVDDGAMPAPDTVLVGVGSTCTSAGLLVGMHAARALGRGWKTVPRLVSARVTPWPITSVSRIVALARRVAILLAELTGDPRMSFSKRELSSRFEVDGRGLGRGYGYSTPDGIDAIRVFREGGAFELDTTYSAKSAACAIARVRVGLEGPLVYWATKSTVPLPEVREEEWRSAPKRLVRWIEETERQHPPP